MSIERQIAEYCNQDNGIYEECPDCGNSDLEYKTIGCDELLTCECGWVQDNGDDF